MQVIRANGHFSKGKVLMLKSQPAKSWKVCHFATA